MEYNRTVGDHCCRKWSEVLSRASLCGVIFLRDSCSDVSGLQRVRTQFRGNIVYKLHECGICVEVLP